ncbi:hypothetical protein ACQ7VH_004599 [Vibrio parahaemolyticus]|nr:hypothetical protein [Vibrio parahaemolyticus]
MSNKCNETCQIAFETTQQQLDKEQALAAQAKALSHPARLRILKQAGFISAEPNPPKVCYRIQREKLNAFNAQFSGLFS